jgi:uncharacterized membrane protein YuzA (DUF378 family)
LRALVAKPRFEGQKKESKKQLGLILVIIGGFVTFVGIAGLLILLVLFIFRKSEEKRANSKINRSVDDRV